MMNILITNDDGYRAKGLLTLVKIMRPYGRITVIAPKYPQSGMSMAVSMGFRQIAAKRLPDQDGVRWYYLDATPASCVKFGIDNVFADEGLRPDIVVSGINHGSNAATAANYSGTLGAAEEAAVNGIPAIGVSIATMSPNADFSCVGRFFPDIFDGLTSSPAVSSGIYYNVNFPNLPISRIKGVRVAHQGSGHWEREFIAYDPTLLERNGIDPDMFGPRYAPAREEGEELYMMGGEFKDDSGDDALADHHVMTEGYVAICAHNVLNSDVREINRLRGLGMDRDFI